MITPAVRFHYERPAPVSMREEILQGLAARPRRIAPKYFYDKRGSRLFDAICELPEYYLTRAETEILESCADELARLIGRNSTLIELGSGAGRKIRLLLEALKPRRYLAVDISREILNQSVQRLACDYPWLEVHASCTDFAGDIELPKTAIAGRKIVFFPGSTIGNFEPHEAREFLQRQRRLIQPDGGLIIGVDLKKNPFVLHAAYNDSAGLTAAFNLNLLERLRRELGASIAPQGFQHRAFYNDKIGRIEMHLVSRCAQEVRIAGQRIYFEADESIHTENSYKYTLEEFHALTRSAGLRPRQVWRDADHRFSVHLLGVISRSRPRLA